jgi:hypothetical protein
VPSHGPCLLTFSRGGGGGTGVGGGQQQFGARARGGAVGRWGWCGPTCRRGGSAGTTAKGQNHGVNSEGAEPWGGALILRGFFRVETIFLCRAAPLPPSLPLCGVVHQLVRCGLAVVHSDYRWSLAI